MTTKRGRPNFGFQVYCRWGMRRKPALCCHKARMRVVKDLVEPAEQVAMPGAAGGSEALQGGEASLEALYRAHHPRIVAVLWRVVGDRSQAEDIAGDVFCKLMRRPAILGGRDLRWLYRVAVNAGFDALRSRARRLRREEAAGVESMRSGRAAGALDDMLRAERQARVRQTLQAMKPRDARLLLLRSSGAAYREIADALGIAPGSVGTLLARAESAFESKFRARYGDAI